jgi:hypothetical protein
MTKNVNNNMGPILNFYEDRVLFNFVSALLRTAQRKSQYASLYQLEQEISGNSNWQIATRADSQPNGRVGCGRRWHFRKSSYTTCRCKLKSETEVRVLFDVLKIFHVIQDGLPNDIVFRGCSPVGVTSAATCGASHLQ